MIRRPPRSTRTDTLFPYTTLFRSSVRTYASADGTWKLTIYPRELTNQLDYFQDKVDGKPNAGGIPGDSRKSPIGHMERRQDGHWLTVWKAPLANDVAPVDAVVSNAGVSMTFDTWHGLGWRSEERRVGKECVSTCSYRRSP